MMRQTGRILKSVGGFYYVEVADTVYECRARGRFRKDDISPVAGDFVEIELQGEGKATVDRILPRKNSLIRPPLANLDQLIIVCSVKDPAPNLFIIDKLLAIAEHQHIVPVIVFTKCDLDNPDQISRIYQRAGFSVVCLSNVEVDDGCIEQIKAILKDKVSAFTGNTGVGKSSLLNNIDHTLSIETAQISQKLGRGRHTTRQTQLYRLPFGGYLADTPGFSTVDIEQYARIEKSQLQFCFRDFEDHLGGCKFNDCSHTVEAGCGVLAAVQQGMIAPSRHKSYLMLYDEAKKVKDWQR